MDSLLGRESVVLFPIELHCGGWELTKKAFLFVPTCSGNHHCDSSMFTTVFCVVICVFPYCAHVRPVRSTCRFNVLFNPCGRRVVSMLYSMCCLHMLFQLVSFDMCGRRVVSTACFDVCFHVLFRLV